jgi:predicted Zn-dependent protease
MAEKRTRTQQMAEIAVGWLDARRNIRIAPLWQESFVDDVRVWTKYGMSYSDEGIITFATGLGFTGK